MRTVLKKWISVLLALVLVIQLLPASAVAADGDDEILIIETEEEESEGGEDEIHLIDEEEELDPTEEIDLESNSAPRYTAADVLWENDMLREASAKHFHISDGSEMAIVYASPVHYRNADGTYQDIDNTLVLCERGEWPLQPKAEPADIPAEPEEPTVPIEPEEPGEEVVIIEIDPVDEAIDNAAPEKGEDDDELLNKEYRNKAGLLDVRLAALSDAEDLVMLSDGEHTISFTPAWEVKRSPAVVLEQFFPYDSESFEAAIMPKTLNGSLRYEEISAGLDLEYCVQPCGVKETLTLWGPEYGSSFSFLMDLGDLLPMIGEDGSILFYDNAGESVMMIPAGYMTDALGAFSDAITYDLEPWEDGRYLFTISADEGWLTEEERAYPVSIDPTLRTYGSMDNYNIECATIDSLTPNTPAIHNELLKVGGQYQANNSMELMRTLVRINSVPSLPAGSILVNASFHFFETSFQQTGMSSLRIAAQALSTNSAGGGNLWCIGKSWNTAPAPRDKIIDYATASSSTGYYALEWYDDSSSNYGFVLKAVNESDFSSSSYANATFTINGATICHPYFEVQYRKNVGIENYYSYHTQSIDRAGSAHVGDMSRQLTLVKTDATKASAVNPVVLCHIYNSAFSGGEYSSQAINSSGRYGNMSLGYGWKLSAQQTCSYHTNGYLTYNDADGTTHYLKQVGGGNSNVFMDEDGLGLTAVASGGGENFSFNTNYTLSDPYGNVKYFSSGTLLYEQDVNGNRIEYNFDNEGRIISIVRKNYGAASETIATLTYSGNRLAFITDSAGNTTNFSYTGNYLTGVTCADGASATYSYSSSGKMTNASDNESEYSINYSWSSGKLTKIKEQGSVTTGATIAISGEPGKTSFRSSGKNRTLNDEDDLIENCLFDFLGRTITDYSTNYNGTIIYSAAGGEYTVNSETSRSNNRLLSSTSVGMRPVQGFIGNYSCSTQNLLYIDGASSWYGTGSVANSIFDQTNNIYVSSILLNGSITGNAYEYKSITIPSAFRNPGQTFILSGWAKAESAALKDNRTFALKAKLTYTDDSEETQSVSFCPDSTEWQYAVLPIVPHGEYGVKKIIVYFSYNKNVNSAVFANACLTAEIAASYTYDAEGNLTSVSAPGTATPTYVYDGPDMVTNNTRGSGTYEYEYDSHHQVTNASNDGLEADNVYNLTGNVISTMLSGTGINNTINSSATYSDNGNRLLTQTDPRGNVTSYSYSNAISKQTGQPTKVKDALNHETYTTYDSNNGRVTGSSTTGVSLAYTYGNGQMTGMTRTADSSTQTYGMTYNTWNRLTGVSVGERPLASYTYTSHNGQLSKLRYGNEQYETYTYDELERVKTVQYNNGDGTIPGLTYTYTGEGTLGTLTDHANSRVYNYSYDNLYRLTGLSETFTDSNNATHSVQNYSVSYDDASRVSGYSYTVYPGWDGGANVTRSYQYGYNNSDGSLSSMSSSLASYALNYDGLKRLSSVPVQNYSGGALFTKSYSYLSGAGTNDTTTLVSTYKVKKPTSGNFVSYTYAYDALGNITGITDNSSNTTSSYTYDALNQLTDATQGGVTYAYTYDKAGNILSKKVNNGTPINYKYEDTDGWKDLLTKYNGHTISYDDIGNPTKWYDNAQMTWVNGRRLASITAVSGVHDAMSFTYDSDGLRLTKTVGGVEHRYTWQGGKLIAEYWDNGKAMEFFYGPDGSIDGFNYKASANGSRNSYYYVKNLQGDVVAIVNKNGEVKAEYTYDPFGKVLSVTNASGTSIGDTNPIRYRGYYYDQESGFYYLQSRYYDPNLCRFINADGLASTGQGFIGCNMFAYCLNNPVNGADPSGKWMWYIDGDGNCLPTEYSCDSDYVIYYYNSLSGKNMDELAAKHRYSSRFTRKAVGTVDEFTGALNHLPDGIDNLYIYVHGGVDRQLDGILCFYGEEEVIDSTGILERINKLSIKGDVYLFACNGAFIAHSLALATGEDVYASFLGVSFTDGYARNSRLQYGLAIITAPSLVGWFRFPASGGSIQETMFMTLR